MVVGHGGDIADHVDGGRGQDLALATGVNLRERWG